MMSVADRGLRRGSDSGAMFGAVPYTATRRSIGGRDRRRLVASYPWLRLERLARQISPGTLTFPPASHSRIAGSWVPVHTHLLVRGDAGALSPAGSQDRATGTTEGARCDNFREIPAFHSSIERKWCGSRSYHGIQGNDVGVIDPSRCALPIEAGQAIWLWRGQQLDRDVETESRVWARIHLAHATARVGPMNLVRRGELAGVRTQHGEYRLSPFNRVVSVDDDAVGV
jgi:hypothetical protein